MRQAIRNGLVLVLILVVTSLSKSLWGPGRLGVVAFWKPLALTKTPQVTNTTTAKVSPSNDTDNSTAGNDDKTGVDNKTEGNDDKTGVDNTTQDNNHTDKNDNTTTHCPVNHCLALGDTPEQQYPNLWILDGGGKSGLYDRLGLLTHLANLAAAYCARLQVPPPHKLLTSFHNRGKKIPSNLTWHDFARCQFLNTSRTVQGLNDGPLYPRAVWDIFLLGEEANQRNSSSTATTIHSFNHTEEVSGDHDYYEMWKIVQQQRQNASQQQGGQQHTDAFVYRMKPKNVWKFLRNTMETKQIQNMMQDLQQDPQAQQAFLPPLQLDYHEPCGYYVDYQFPPNLQYVAELVLQEAARLAGGKKTTTQDALLWFGFLHIRRGDIAKACDTSLEKMTRYIQCTFSGPETTQFLQQRVQQQQLSSTTVPRGETPWVLFLASDEKNVTYRQELLRLMEQPHQEQRPHVVTTNGTNTTTTTTIHAIRALDLDALILQVLHREIAQGNVPADHDNNQMVFLIGRIISQLAVVTLEQRKAMNCDDCNRDKVEPALVPYNRLLASSSIPYDTLRAWQQDKWQHLTYYDKTLLRHNYTQQTVAT